MKVKWGTRGRLGSFVVTGRQIVMPSSTLEEHSHLQQQHFWSSFTSGLLLLCVSNEKEIISLSQEVPTEEEVDFYAQQIELNPFGNPKTYSRI